MPGTTCLQEWSTWRLAAPAICSELVSVSHRTSARQWRTPPQDVGAKKVVLMGMGFPNARRKLPALLLAAFTKAAVMSESCCPDTDSQDIHPVVQKSGCSTAELHFHRCQSWMERLTSGQRYCLVWMSLVNCLYVQQAFPKSTTFASAARTRSSRLVLAAYSSSSPLQGYNMGAQEEENHPTTGHAGRPHD